MVHNEVLLEELVLTIDNLVLEKSQYFLAKNALKTEILRFSKKVPLGELCNGMKVPLGELFKNQ